MNDIFQNSNGRKTRNSIKLNCKIIITGHLFKTYQSSHVSIFYLLDNGSLGLRLAGIPIPARRNRYSWYLHRRRCYNYNDKNYILVGLEEGNNLTTIILHRI